MRARLIGLSVLLALAAADTLAWRIATAQLERGTGRWVADARQHGWAVTQGKHRPGGWPFAARLAIARPAISGGDRLVPGGLAWSGERLVLSVSLLHPATLALSAEGQQHARLSHLPDLVFNGQSVGADIRLWGARTALASIHALGVAGGIAGSRHPQDVQLGSLAVQLTGLSDGGAAPAFPSARLDLQAEGIGLPDTGRWPLGGTIRTLSGALTLTSPAAGAVRAAGSGNAADQAQAWRDGGGRLVAQDIRLRWGPVAVVAEATLQLDARLQPAGSGSADVTGSQAGLGALSDAGLISPGLAATGGALLALMPHAPTDPAALRLPFVLRDNTVLVGEIPVVHLHDIVWRGITK